MRWLKLGVVMIVFSLTVPTLTNTIDGSHSHRVRYVNSVKSDACASVSVVNGQKRKENRIHLIA